MSDDGRVGELGPVADQRGFGIWGELGISYYYLLYI